MKRTIILTIFLTLAIWSNASVNLIIAYTNNDKASELSALLVEQKFNELYPNSNVSKVATMKDVISAFKIKADTLIFYFVGHSNRVTEPEKANYMGNLVMILDFNAADKQNIQDYMLVSKSLHYLLRKSMSSKKLVILDGCYAQNVYDNTIKNTTWLLSSEQDKGSLIAIYSEFSRVFCQLLTKGITISELHVLINEALSDKSLYPDYNAELVYGKEYQNESVYPQKSISINDFKF